MVDWRYCHVPWTYQGSGCIFIDMNTTSHKATARDFFLNLFHVGSLFALVIAFLVLVFSVINYFFPDPSRYYYYEGDGMLTAISILIIAVPALIVTGIYIGKAYKRSPESRDYWVRRWLSYFTLFAAGVTFAVTLIILINGLLRGELTSRFLLKSIFVMAVAAIVSRYYLWDIHREDEKSVAPRLMAWLVIAVAVAGVIVGFVVAGTPGERRSSRLDNERINDLSRIESQVNYYYDQNDVLPLTLDQLNGPLNDSFFADPETGLQYEYRVTDKTSFELCANFSGSSYRDGVARPSYIAPRQDWEHESGHQCFERDLYISTEKNDQRTPPVPLR